MSARGRTRVIRASEIGEYVYCHRAWWLGRVIGVENANRTELEAGIARHQAHGRTVRLALIMRQAAIVLVLAAVLIGLVLLWLSFGHG